MLGSPQSASEATTAKDKVKKRRTRVFGDEPAASALSNAKGMSSILGGAYWGPVAQ